MRLLKESRCAKTHTTRAVLALTKRVRSKHGPPLGDRVSFLSRTRLLRAKAQNTANTVVVFFGPVNHSTRRAAAISTKNIDRNRMRQSTEYHWIRLPPESRHLTLPKLPWAESAITSTASSAYMPTTTAVNKRILILKQLE